MDFAAAFKSLVWDQLVKLALSRLFAAVPLLGWGPIGWVVSWAVNWVATKIFDAVKLFIELEAIVFRNKQAQKEFETASIKLRLIAMGSGEGSPEFLAAREEHKSALSKFVRFDSARE